MKLITRCLMMPFCYLLPPLVWCIQEVWDWPPLAVQKTRNTKGENGKHTKRAKRVFPFYKISEKGEKVKPGKKATTKPENHVHRLSLPEFLFPRKPKFVPIFALTPTPTLPALQPWTDGVVGGITPYGSLVLKTTSRNTQADVTLVIRHPGNPIRVMTKYNEQ